MYRERLLYQKKLTETIEVCGMPYTGKTSILARIAREMPQNFVAISEPYDIARQRLDKSKLGFTEKDNSMMESLLTTELPLRRIVMENCENDLAVGKIFLQDRGMIDNEIFCRTYFDLGKIRRKTYERRTQFNWGNFSSEWLIFFLVSPEMVQKRARENMSKSKICKDLRFLKRLECNYYRKIEYLQRHNANIKVFNMSDDQETSFKIFKNWVLNERY
jgi:thymidylate kinase